MSTGVKKRILVAGGAGFLGSHLCAHLLAQGHEVLCLDNFISGSKRNIRRLIGHPYFECLRADVTHPVRVEVDEIYNLACPASPMLYQKHPVETTKASVHGSINLLELARDLDAKILLASTSEVYGDPGEHPQRETYWGHVNPIGPRSCYDEGKRCAETLFFDYARQYGTRIKVARIFNTYGPHMHPHDGRVISNFIMQALNGEPITLFGDGSQTRAFCYVSDMIAGLTALMASPREVTGPINLGNPAERTIAEIADLVLRLTGCAAAPVRRPLPADDPRRRCPDISLAKSLLHWQPAVDLEQGLTDTIAYFRSLTKKDA